MRLPVAILVALIAVAVALIAVELTVASGKTVTVADPCRVRAPFPGQGIDATIQRLVLDGLDRAACRLDTTREELVLSLAPGSQKRRWSQKEIDSALRSGLLTSVKEAENRGDIPAFLAPIVRRVVENVPLEKLIQGGISLSDLIG